jgi:hypothetical protein
LFFGLNQTGDAAEARETILRINNECRFAGFKVTCIVCFQLTKFNVHKYLVIYFRISFLFTENNAQSGKDASGVLIRNGKNTGSASPRSAAGKDSKDVFQSVTRSLSGKDLIKDSSGLSPRKDSGLSLARSQSGKDLLRDSSDSSFRPRDGRDAATRLTLSRSQSGKELIRDLSLSPRSHSSKDSGTVLSRSQSGKELVSTDVSSRHQTGREVCGSSLRSVSGKDLNDGGSPSRSVPSSSRTRRVGVTDRRGLTPSTGTTGSSDKEVGHRPHLFHYVT